MLQQLHGTDALTQRGGGLLQAAIVEEAEGDDLLLLTREVRHALRQVGRVLAPGGSALLSGVLGVQAAALRSPVEAAGFEISDPRERGEWIAMRISRRGG